MAIAKRASKNLYTSQFLSPKAVRQLMAGLAKRLEAEFKDRTRRRAQILEQMNKYRVPPRDPSGKKKQAAKVFEAIRQQQIDASRHAVRRPQGPRQEHTAVPGLEPMAGTIPRPGWPNWLMPGGSVAPPYDQNSWGWSVQPSGSPGGGTLQKNSETVNPNSGEMSVDIESGFKYGYAGVNASGNAMVGITIFPYSILPANLQVCSSPSLNYSWGYWLDDPTPPGAVVYRGCVEASGWIRQMIVEATPSQFGDIVVDQKTILWNSSYCLGYPGSAQWQVGSNASLGICSPQIPVNPEKFYVIFVGCEAEIYALPDGGSSSAVAWATLNVSVPSITWQLTPRVPTVVASNRRLPLPRTR